MTVMTPADDMACADFLGPLATDDDGVNGWTRGEAMLFYALLLRAAALDLHPDFECNGNRWISGESVTTWAMRFYWGEHRVEHFHEGDTPLAAMIAAVKEYQSEGLTS